MAERIIMDFRKTEEEYFLAPGLDMISDNEK
jgi:hypothetical protein